MAAFQPDDGFRARPPPPAVEQADELPTTLQPDTKSEDPPLWNEFSPISEQSLDSSKRQLATGSDSGQLHAQATEEDSSALHISKEKRSQISESQQSLKITINGLKQERKRLRDENKSLRIENEKLREENKSLNAENESLKQAKRPRYDHSQLTTEPEIQQLRQTVRNLESDKRYLKDQLLSESNSKCTKCYYQTRVSDGPPWQFNSFNDSGYGAVEDQQDDDETVMVFNRR